MKNLYLTTFAKIALGAFLLPLAVQAQQYDVTSIPHQMYAPETSTPFQATVDDKYSPLISLPFDFYFFGQGYEALVISTNGYIDFRPEKANENSPWSFQNTIPHANFPVKNSILACFNDMNAFADEDEEASITYSVTGNAPFRKFVLTFYEQPLYECGNDAESTFQAVLYETFDYIDIQIVKREACMVWNGGRAVVGVVNETGTVAYAAPGRNTGPWNVLPFTPEGWRFIPDNENVYHYMVCDTDTDGTEEFNFSALQDELGFPALFYMTKEDAEDETNSLAGTDYTNTIAYQPGRLFTNQDGQILEVRLSMLDCSIDSDEDNVPTSLEDINADGNLFNDDTDSDGIPDFADNDDDGDLVLTQYEYVFDNAGFAAFTTFTTDNPAALDTDNDGIPNYLDNDDDGDGVLTNNERFNIYSSPGTTDSDGDDIPNFLDDDDDGDGILTINDEMYTYDSDGDALPNYMDTDDDGDGVPTIAEDLDNNSVFSDDDLDGDTMPNYLDIDDDNDGVDTEYEDANGSWWLLDDDTDGDTIFNYLDNDDDGDGILTYAENGDTDDDDLSDYLDSDDDGDGHLTLNETGDTDNDTVPNYLENDDDGDGYLTIDEEGDTDNDTILNYLDSDDDGDGHLTLNEIGDTDNDTVLNYLDSDDDGDGHLTLNEIGDTDNDTVLNYLDNDDDGDGYLTLNETGDTDNDTVLNYLDSDDDADGYLTLNEVGDTDNDTVLNYLDSDDDGDGHLTLNEIGDTDNDTVLNYLDNDDDGDGHLTLNEVGDTDNDTVLNYLDSDDDGDGHLTLNETEDTDNDTVLNYLDSDDDGDGHLTLNEIGDTDNDTVLDYLDNDDDGDSVLTIDEEDLDTDNDTIPNYLDSDDDGDGIATIDEDYNENGDPADDDLNANGIPDYLETNTAGIPGNALHSAITMYPNPASDVLNIVNGTGRDITGITIYALNGAVVKQISSANAVNVSDLQDGVYIVKIQVNDQVLNYRFIKK